MWCESHFIYRNRLDEIRDYFHPIKVKFRVGAETFDPKLRNKWQKGIPEEITAEDISKYFDGVCLLICVKGQNKKIIINDIKKAFDNFEYFNINVFNPNSTKEELDYELLKWFTKDIYPYLIKYDNIEVLIDNTDLGVGERDKF